MACNFKSSMFLLHLLRRIVLFMIRICCIWGVFVIYEQQKVYFWVLEYLIFLHPRLYFSSVRGWNYIKIQYQKTPADSNLHVGCFESWFKCFNFILSRYTLLHVPPQVWYCTAQIRIGRMLLLFPYYICLNHGFRGGLGGHLCWQALSG